VNIPLLIKQAIGQVHARGNLPFPTLVSDLVAATGVPREAMDTKAIILAKGDVVPSGKYLQLPMNNSSLDIAPQPTIPTTSSSPLQQRPTIKG